MGDLMKNERALNLKIELTEQWRRSYLLRMWLQRFLYKHPSIARFARKGAYVLNLLGQMENDERLRLRQIGLKEGTNQDAQQFGSG